MDSFLRNPISVSVKTSQSSENVNQTVVKVDSKNKIDILHDLLIKPEAKKSIIFAGTKRSADKLAKALRERGFNIAAIHGDKTQAQRGKALAAFKQDKITILLATDVVARGLMLMTCHMSLIMTYHKLKKIIFTELEELAVLEKLDKR